MARFGWLLAAWFALMVGVGLAEPQPPAKPAERPAEKPLEKPAADKTIDDYELMRLLADTVAQVERNYVKEIDRRELVEAAIEGMLAKLDPYSSYIKRKEMDQFRSTMENEFGGIGIQLDNEDGSLRVSSPLVGTPAYRAGILAGDRIVEIEGKNTERMNREEAVRLLKGKPGTSVRLAVVHADQPGKKEVTLTRELIHVETVLGYERQSDDSWNFLADPSRRIGYIRLTAFGRDSAKDLRKAVDSLKSRKLNGLILDLRFNPGGLLNAAIEVSDLFVSKGRIVSVGGRNSPDRVWDARGGDVFEGFPMVVLVNRFSASASEIVAACLQDHGRAVVMGERTWGKGSVQNVIDMENGHSALKLTTASYHRPSGKNIHRFPNAKESDEWGVVPDKGYHFKLSEQEMTAMIRDRRDRDIVRPHSDANSDDGQKPVPRRGSRTGPRARSKPVEDASETSKKPGPEAADPHLRMAIDYLKGELAQN